MATVKLLPPTNGKATHVETKPAPAEQQPQAPETSTPAPLPEIMPEERPCMTIEDKFFKLDQLLSHRIKYEKLSDCLTKLNKFNLTSIGAGDNITLKDPAGLTFSTHNPKVLRQVIELLKTDLTGQLAELNELITL